MTRQGTMPLGGRRHHPAGGCGRRQPGRRARRAWSTRRQPSSRRRRASRTRIAARVGDEGDADEGEMECRDGGGDVLPKSIVLRTINMQAGWRESSTDKFRSMEWNDRIISGEYYFTWRASREVRCDVVEVTLSSTGSRTNLRPREAPPTCLSLSLLVHIRIPSLHRIVRHGRR